jgi:hypothetical protein
MKVKEKYATCYLMGRAANQSPASRLGPLGFNPSPVEVRFMVDEVAQVEFLLRVLRYSPISIIR